MTTTLNRSEQVQVRLRQHERGEWERAARMARMTLSEFIRLVMTPAVQRRLARAGEQNGEQEQVAA